MTFNPHLTPFDEILLGDKRDAVFQRLNSSKFSPGLASVHGASSDRKWTEEMVYGAGGAITRYRGKLPSKFSVQLRLYSDADWIDWYEWKTRVDREPARFRPRHLSIWHPWLEALDIKEVGIKGVMQPVEIDNGGHMIEIKFIEHRIPVVKLVSPKAADSPTPLDDQDIRLLELRGERGQLVEHLAGLPS